MYFSERSKAALTYETHWQIKKYIIYVYIISKNVLEWPGAYVRPTTLMRMNST